MPLPKPTALLFDLDGTLMRHKSEKLIASLERYDTILHILTKPFQSPGRRMPHEMDLTVNVQSNPYMHRLIHMIRQSRGIHVEDVVEPEVGVKDLLDFAMRHAIKMGVTSNAYGRLYGHPVLKHYGFAKYFDSTVFRENTKRGKPHAEPVLRSVKSLGLDEGQEQHIWFIGDQAKDIKAVMQARDKLPANWHLHPVAFAAPNSTAYFYLSRLEDPSICNQNYTRNFSHLLNKLFLRF